MKERSEFGINTVGDLFHLLYGYEMDLDLDELSEGEKELHTKRMEAVLEISQPLRKHEGD